jgi:dipeptidyl aminopeptidase/acylaminoacyl peptidase
MYVVDLKTYATHTLDNDSRSYVVMSWNEDGTALVALKATDVPKKVERVNSIVAIPDVRAAIANPVYRPATLDSTSTGFPRGWVISDRQGPVWSKDGRYIFFSAKPQVDSLDPELKKKGADELADVDVWHWNEPVLHSVQLSRLNSDRTRTYRQAFDVGGGRFIMLTDSTMPDIEIPREGRWGFGRDARAYASDWKEPRSDFYLVDLATGSRKLIVKDQITSSQGAHVFGASPDGHYFLYWRDMNFQLFDSETGKTINLTAKSPAGFFRDVEEDHPVTPHPYGTAGWTKDGKTKDGKVILTKRYDLWLQPLDGSPATNLTQGVGDKLEAVLRPVRFDYTPDPYIDLSKPIVFTAYGQWTKKFGYYQLTGGKMSELVYMDAKFRVRNKAKNAERYLVTKETFVEFPDLHLSGPDFRNLRRLTYANPQQGEYVWGKRILFDYKNRKGVRLQGILAIPDDYRPGERRPMIVDFYEKRSQEMHDHVAPAYLYGFGGPIMEAVSKGYLMMEPDVHFGSNAAHADMLECIEAAVTKVIEMGYADPKRVGLHGHSFSGQGAAYISGRSKMFAAVGIGAAATELWGDFSRFWGWSYTVPGVGANAANYDIYGQGRLGTDPWKNPTLYREQSALSHVRTVNQPVLILHGTSDGVVGMMEAMQFFNALRFNEKNAILLAYIGEGHGLGQRGNQIDFTIRTMQFFDHYLRGLPAPRWMREGVPHIFKDWRKDPAAELQ